MTIRRLCSLKLAIALLLPVNVCLLVAILALAAAITLLAFFIANAAQLDITIRY